MASVGPDYDQVIETYSAIRPRYETFGIDRHHAVTNSKEIYDDRGNRARSTGIAGGTDCAA
jgi:hypothetical protein